MLRRGICSALFVLLLLMSQDGMAGTSDTTPLAKMPVIKTYATTVKPVVPSVVQLTQLRWANHTDAVTGASRLRLVFDVTGPVEVDSAVSGMPTPRLAVNVKGAIPGKIDNSIDLDGKIADGVIISADGQNTKIIIEMPLMVEEDDYKVFVLPADLRANKPCRVVVDINKPMPPMVFNFTAGLKNKVIAIDPGHGGSDPGAIGMARNQEKTVNLAVALKVKALLEKAGAKVLMTRDDDVDVYGPNSSAVDELKARTTIANVKKADIFVSIHSNAAANRTAGGTATYYYQKTRYDSVLARNLQAGMVQNGDLQDRGYFPANFYVVKRAIMPAALVELAFLSNPEEERLLVDPQFQQKLAQGIVQGIDKFFSQARSGGEWW